MACRGLRHAASHLLSEATRRIPLPPVSRRDVAEHAAARSAATNLTSSSPTRPTATRSSTRRSLSSSSPGCARTRRRSSPTGSGTAAASLAIKGEDEDFRRGMVAAYKRMTECMPDNGIQVIMFTHQSGSHLGGHGQHRLGLGPAGHRRLVRRHRDRQRAARGQLRQGHGAARLPQAPRHAQDHPRRSRLGDPGGGRGAGRRR